LSKLQHTPDRPQVRANTTSGRRSSMTPSQPPRLAAVHVSSRCRSGRRKAGARRNDHNTVMAREIWPQLRASSTHQHHLTGRVRRACRPTRANLGAQGWSRSPSPGSSNKLLQVRSHGTGRPASPSLLQQHGHQLVNHCCCIPIREASIRHFSRSGQHVHNQGEGGRAGV